MKENAGAPPPRNNGGRDLEKGDMYDAKKDTPSPLQRLRRKQTEKGTGARGACGGRHGFAGPDGKKPGARRVRVPQRGMSCQSAQSRRIARALEVSIPEEIYDAMAAEIEKAGAQKGETHAG